MAVKNLTGIAQKLRRNETRPEEKLWAYVRGRNLGGYKFKRQFPIGDFVADFVCLRSKLIVELDGSHHGDQKNKDAARTKKLERFGYRVIRIWNHEVIENIEGTLDHILHELESRTY